MIPKKFDELRLTGALPSPSAVGMRILDLTRREDFAIDELAQTIMIDGALSGRVVRLANSAGDSRLEPATTIVEATKRLGANRLRTLALGFTLVSDNRSGRCENFDYDGYWAGALAMAVAANVIAARTASGDPLEAFTAGLVSNIGCLALACVHPLAYSELLGANPDADPSELASLENAAFGITHAEVAGSLMEDWGLPPTMIEAVMRHERAPESEEGPLVSTLRSARAIAGVLVKEGERTAESWRHRFEDLTRAAHALHMRAEELCSLCEAVQAEWADWGRMLDIPVEGQDLVAELVREWASEIGEEGATEASLEDEEATRAAAASADESAEATRILLIDDDERMLRLLRHHLSREGYEVFTATSSETGLQKALELAPQIVITDWMMPGMSGVGLCATLRKTEAGSRMYILIVTAREDDEQVVEAFGAGADDYIVKPFNPRILLARVRAGQRMIRMRERVEQAERERLRQVAELGIMTRRLRAAALTDALTELPNRRYAMDRLRQEWDSAERTGRPLSVVMLDLDHFKRVNDVHGHDAGDLVLRESSRVMRASSRSGDVLCRLGGEEFLSINVGCDGERAVVLAERLRAAVEGTPIAGEGFALNVTVSLGVAQKTPGMRGIDDLLKASDEALYLAKASGRNRVWLAGTEPDRKSA